MVPIPPFQRRCLGACVLLGGLLVGLPRAWSALDPAPSRIDRGALGGPQVRVLLREAQVLSLRAPAGGRLRLRDGAGQVLMELGPDQPLRLQLDGAQVLAQAEAGDGEAAPGPGAPLALTRGTSGPSAATPYRSWRSPAAGGPGPAPSAALSPAYDSATGTPLGPRPGISAPLTPAAAPSSADPPAAAPVALARPAPALAQRLRADALVVEPLAAGGSEGSVWLQKRRYRGSLWIRPQGEALQAVNLVGLETYLASVVGSEMPASWPLEALRAQAVAARTYALRALRPGRGRAYDLKATVASQVYLGVEAETASTQAAVAGTRGLVLTYGDGLIEAVFHSSAGGTTENSGDLWAQQLPYLVSVADFDTESPVRDWRLPLSDELVRKGFPEIGSLERIEVLSTSSSGRVRQARVVGSAGAVLVSGAELRSRLGLKSTLVQFAREAVSSPLLADPVGAASGPPAALSPAPGLIGSLVRASPASEPLGTGGAALAAPTAWPTPAPPAAANPLVPPPLPSGASSPAKGIWQWVAIGRGFGHGIGMSQWGALAMARRGDGFEQILQHYYRGTQLRPYDSLAALAPLLQPRLGLGPLPPRPLALTLGTPP